MRSLAFLAAALVAFSSSSVLAAVGVPGNSARFEWEPSTGPVVSYLVEVSRNGGPFEAEKTVWGTKVTVTGQLHEELSVRVIALGPDGSRSAPSEVSDAIKFSGWGSTDSGGSNANNAGSNANSGASKANNAGSNANSGASNTKSIRDDTKKSESNSQKRDFSATSSGSNAKSTRSSANKSKSSAKRSKSSATGGGSNAAATSSQPPPLSANRGLGAMPFDFNGDGRTDLLWHNVETHAVAVWFMNGTPNPPAAVLGRLDERWSPVGSGDFDGDGHADLLLRNSLQGTSEIWLIDKDRVRSAAPVDGPGSNWTAEAIGDFDGDGYADVLWQKKEKNLIWFMHGSVVDEKVYGSEAPESSTAACAPELDGDGRSDLIWSGDRETAAWLMDGSSPWRSGRAGPQMATSLVLGCGDADGDGIDDVLWYHPESRRGILWVMNGDIAKDRSFGLPPLGWGWRMEASGDFDGDGRANDMLLRHSNTGELEFWRLQWNRWSNGFGIASTKSLTRVDGSWQVITP